MSGQNFGILMTDPADYVPYGTVDLCGNILQNVQYILEVRGNHPLLIGKGLIPYIWLQAPLSANLDQWMPLMERSTSLQQGVTITALTSGVTKVLVQGQTLLHIAQVDQDTLKVLAIDLRLIGLNVHGSGSELAVGGSTFSGNKMTNGRAFFALA